MERDILLPWIHYKVLPEIIAALLIQMDPKGSAIQVRHCLFTPMSTEKFLQRLLFPPGAGDSEGGEGTKTTAVNGDHLLQSAKGPSLKTCFFKEVGALCNRASRG